VHAQSFFSPLPRKRASAQFLPIVGETRRVSRVVTSARESIRPPTRDPRRSAARGARPVANDPHERGDHLRLVFREFSKVDALAPPRRAVHVQAVHLGSIRSAKVAAITTGTGTYRDHVRALAAAHAARVHRARRGQHVYSRRPRRPWRSVSLFPFFFLSSAFLPPPAPPPSRDRESTRSRGPLATFGRRTIAISRRRICTLRDANVKLSGCGFRLHCACGCTEHERYVRK